MTPPDGAPLSDVRSAASGLAGLLDVAQTVLAPLAFVTEAARTADGPCGCAADCGGRRALLPGRFAAAALSPADRAELGRRVDRVWRDHGLRVRIRCDGSLGSEVVATTSAGDVLVFGGGPTGVTLSGETGCPARAGVTAEEMGMPSGDG